MKRGRQTLWTHGKKPEQKSHKHTEHNRYRKNYYSHNFADPADLYRPIASLALPYMDELLHFAVGHDDAAAVQSSSSASSSALAAAAPSRRTSSSTGIEFGRRYPLSIATSLSYAPGLSASDPPGIMAVNYAFKPDSVDQLRELTMRVDEKGESAVVTAAPSLAATAESKTFKGSISTGQRDAVLLFDDGVFVLEAVGRSVQGLKHCREEGGRYDGTDAPRVHVASYLRQLSKSRTNRKKQRVDTSAVASSAAPSSEPATDAALPAAL